MDVTIINGQPAVDVVLPAPVEVVVVPIGERGPAGATGPAGAAGANGTDGSSAALALNVYDNFQQGGTVAAGTKTLSGQPYKVQTVTGSPAVAAAGSLTKADAGAFYAWVEDLTPPDSAWLEFSFAAGTTQSVSGAVLIISSISAASAINAGGVITECIHFVLLPWAYQVDIYTAGVPTTYLVAAYPSELLPDTHYRAGLRRVAADKILVYLPTGETLLWTEPSPGRFDALWGGTVLHEIIRPSATFATDRVPALHSIATSGTYVPRPVQITQAAYNALSPPNPAVLYIVIG